tara:strand:- start:200 stop:520 length:321 start_codon:yes stop_codon:yes gene_type:complete
MLVKKNNFVKLLTKCDVFINASSLGNLKLVNKSPLKTNQIKHLKNKYVFDVNFKPRFTKLIKIAIQQKIDNQNGKAMNLFQACEAFKKVYPNLNLTKIVKIMSSVK